MNVNKMIIGVLVMLFIISIASADNEVYLPETTYIPECGTTTIEILLNASDDIDTWSTMIEFDNTCINITDVNFIGSITPNNASWGHHGNYIYLGGTELTASNGNELLLATLTVECLNSGECSCDLKFTGIENEKRLIAGPPDGMFYSATWVNGIAQCVECGDVNCDTAITIADVLLLLNHLSTGYEINCEWAANVNGDTAITIADILLLLNHLSGGASLNCICS